MVSTVKLQGVVVRIGIGCKRSKFAAPNTEKWRTVLAHFQPGINDGALAPRALSPSQFRRE